MCEPQSSPRLLPRTGKPRSRTYALLPGGQEPRRETSIPGHLCEVCLDASATHLRPAPWGGEMGVCEACQGRDT